MAVTCILQFQHVHFAVNMEDTGNVTILKVLYKLSFLSKSQPGGVHGTRSNV